ncbi:MAG: CBS domain-containing protein [Candidatus Hydrothermarchaeaceae archaeon]
MDTEILIRGIMTKNVVTVSGDMPVSEAARIMEKGNIGSVIVLKGDSPVGIVTERDITYRVVSPDKKPSSVKVSEIMSRPVLTIDPEINITDASKIMAKNNLRRLPVIKNGKLVGIITNKDIVLVAPGQIEILKELSRMRDEVPIREHLDKGTCENCGDYGVGISEVNGIFACENCKDELLSE